MAINQITARKALADLQSDGNEFLTLFRSGSLEVEIYCPNQIDKQSPHRRDEIYVILHGRGYFVSDGDQKHFEPGDVFFVKAGVEHRFVDFSEDFCTWVFFFGPEGGE